MKTSAPTWPGALALLLAFVLYPATGAAQVSEEKLAVAEAFFNAGAQAYDDGQYLAAAESWMKARELVPAPELTFSAAQAYRKQFFVDRQLDHLRLALRLYREYVAAVPHGGRRADAVQGLAELAVFEHRLAGSEPGSAAAPQPPATRVLISARAKGAVISLDGGPVRRAPLFTEVAAGEHTVLVRAPGFADDQTKVLAVKDELVALDVRLRPRRARIEVVGVDDPEIHEDGQRLSPGADKLYRVEAGTHLLAVGRNGHLPYVKELDFERGSLTTVELQLPETTQRRLSYAVLATGGAGVLATALLGGLALGEQASAQAIADDQEAASIAPAERDDYNRAVTRRDDLATATAVTGALSAVTLAAGLSLYLFDRPDLSLTSSEPSDSEPVKAKAVPLLGRSFVGLQIYGEL